MKIAVVCANGKAGRLIVKEAMGRGLDVTAVVRGENHSGAPKAICKDLFDLEAADLAGFDVVIDAFGAWTDETYPLHSSTLKHLCDILSGTETRLLVVGGAGSHRKLSDRGNPQRSVQACRASSKPAVPRGSSRLLCRSGKMKAL